MKRIFWLISAVFVFLSGFIMQISYQTSGAAAWSFIVSSVNESPWEQVKPFVIACIMWSFVKLSVLRPSLLRFVSCEILCIHLFIFISCTFLSIGCFVCNEYLIELLIIFISLTISQALCQRMVNGNKRTELFFVPIMISFGLLMCCILFCSFYPPQLPPFFDSGKQIYGISASELWV